jgi:acyl-CoA thioesterase FadM
VAELSPYPVVIEPSWIDYNGHVRDAFYTLMVSYATDQVMDQLGLDAAYRERTHCTLYTLELHIHYLRELKADDTVVVRTAILAADKKRLHFACRVEAARLGQEAAATAEFMCLHVQQGESVRVSNFPDEVLARVREFSGGPDTGARFGPGSRQIALKRG